MQGWGLNLQSFATNAGLQATLNKAVNQASGFIATVAKVVEGEDEDGDDPLNPSLDQEGGSFEGRADQDTSPLPPPTSVPARDPKASGAPSTSSSMSSLSQGPQISYPATSTYSAPSMAAAAAPPPPPPSTSAPASTPSRSLSDAFGPPPPLPRPVGPAPQQPQPSASSSAPADPVAAAQGPQTSKLAELRAKLAVEKGRLGGGAAGTVEPQQLPSAAPTAPPPAAPAPTASAPDSTSSAALAAAADHARSLEHALNQSRREHADALRESEAMRARLAEAERRLAAAEAQAASAQRDMESVRASAGEAESARRALEASLGQKDAALTAAMARIAALEKESESATTALESSRRHMAAEAVAHGKEVGVLRDEVARLAAKLSQQEAAAAAAAAEVEGQASTSSGASAALLAASAARESELQLENARLSALVQQYESERDQLFEEHNNHQEALSRDLELLKAAVRRSEDSATRMAAELAGALPPAEAEALRQRLAESERERDKARADFQRIKSQFISKDRDDEEKLAWRVEEEVKRRLEREKFQWEEEIAAEVAAAHRSQQEAVSEAQSCRAQLRAIEAQLVAKDGEVQNLNLALGSLAAESDVADTLRHELRVVRERCTELTKDMHALRAAAEAAEGAKRVAEEETGRVRGEVDVWRAREQQSAQEVGILRHALEEALKRLHSIGSESDTLVDRRIISKLLVTYFEHKEDRLKRDVLVLMARMLSLNEKDRARIGLGTHESGVTRKVFGVVGRVAALPLTLMEGGLAMAARQLGQDESESDEDGDGGAGLRRASSGGRRDLFAPPNGHGPLALLNLAERGEGSITDLWLEFLSHQALKVAAEGGSSGKTSKRTSVNGGGPGPAGVGAPISVPGLGPRPGGAGNINVPPPLPAAPTPAAVPGPAAAGPAAGSVSVPGLR